MENHGVKIGKLHFSLALKRICVESAYSRRMGPIRDSDISMRKAGELGKPVVIGSKARELKRLGCWSGIMLVHRATVSCADSHSLRLGSPPKGRVAHL